MTQLKPFYTNVRAHYDLSNEFYELFLDPTMSYSCAYFERDDMTLQEAQIAKLDRAFARYDIRPGCRVLDVGFGWGYAMRHAAERYGARVIGLTLSQAQYDYVEKSLAEHPPTNGHIELRIQGWEQFDEPVDRVMSFEVFEHFRHERYRPFFDRCRKVLTDGGKMVIQTNAWTDRDEMQREGLEVTHEQVKFAKFIRNEIFPGAMLPEPANVIRVAREAGFDVPQVESLRPHYVRTLDHWATALEANRDRAIELTSQRSYDNYLKYLRGCEKYFGTGHIDVPQFVMC
jgi:cyclopropane-fatty-acyl-phospholipid synthase